MSKVKVGIIGANFAATLHAEALEFVPDAEIVAACGVDPEGLAQFAAKWHIPQTYSDYKELLKRADIELVTIAIPNFLHCQAACDALAAGKHVVVEKPLCLTLDESDRMLAAAKAAGKPLMYAE